MIKKLLVKVVSFYRSKHKFSNKCRFDRSVSISPGSEFEGMNQLHVNSWFKGKMGYGSYIGPRSKVSAYVGRFSSIGGDVVTLSGTHPYRAPFVSTAPCFCVTNPNYIQNGGSFVEKDVFEQYRFYDKVNRIDVKIGSDCWIGERVIIIGGVEIGDGAMVLANAVVTKDIPAFAIVGGVPARVIGYRFDEDTISALVENKWWEKPLDWIKNNIDLFCDLETFLKVIRV